MDQTAFRKLRHAVQDNAHPADRRHLAWVQESLEAALERTALFDDIELGRTDDVDRLVIGLCRCREDVLPWEAGVAIERLWALLALDAQWECHAVTSTESMVEFEGALTVDDTGRYVTVTVVAEPAVRRELHVVRDEELEDTESVAARTAG